MPESGWFDGPQHVYALRVYYEDTDAAGVVYYANYLRMAERARTEMMRLLGAEHAAMNETFSVALAVRDCAVEYLSPARLDDVVEIRTQLIEARGASIRLAQDFCCGTRELARLQLRLACLDAAGQPARLPHLVREALERFETQFLPAQVKRA